MTCQRSRGFSLLEVIVVVTIMIIIVALTLPVLKHARSNALSNKCLANLAAIGTAFSLYLQDYRNVYPGGTIYYNGVNVTIAWSNLFGKTGTSGEAAANRILNQYLNYNYAVAECPLDRGDTGDPTPKHEVVGTSYFYNDRTDAQISGGQYRARDGVWSLEMHRSTEIRYPALKTILSDLIFLSNRDATDPVHHWHNATEPLTIGSVFVDGHAAMLPRRTGANLITFATTDVNQLRTLESNALSNNSYY